MGSFLCSSRHGFPLVCSNISLLISIHLVQYEHDFFHLPSPSVAAVFPLMLPKCTPCHLCMCPVETKAASTIFNTKEWEKWLQQCACGLRPQHCLHLWSQEQQHKWSGSAQTSVLYCFPLC